jgi:hypothetical protein
MIGGTARRKWSKMTRSDILLHCRNTRIVEREADRSLGRAGCQQPLGHPK